MSKGSSRRSEITARRPYFFNVNAAIPPERTRGLSLRWQTSPIAKLPLSYALARLWKPRNLSSLPERKRMHQPGSVNIDPGRDGSRPRVLDSGCMAKDLLRKGARIFAMTSSGSTRVWPTYGAVSAGPTSLESRCRQLALELASRGVARKCRTRWRNGYPRFTQNTRQREDESKSRRAATVRPSLPHLEMSPS